jgi:hypothetical protein
MIVEGCLNRHCNTHLCPSSSPRPVITLSQLPWHLHSELYTQQYCFHLPFNHPYRHYSDYTAPRWWIWTRRISRTILTEKNRNTREGRGGGGGPAPVTHRAPQLSPDVTSIRSACKENVWNPRIRHRVHTTSTLTYRLIPDPLQSILRAHKQFCYYPSSHTYISEVTANLQIFQPQPHAVRTSPTRVAIPTHNILINCSRATVNTVHSLVTDRRCVELHLIRCTVW